MGKPSQVMLASALLIALGILSAAVMIVRAVRREAEGTRQTISDAAGSAVSDGIQQTLDAAASQGRGVFNELSDAADSIFGELSDRLKEIPAGPAAQDDDIGKISSPNGPLPSSDRPDVGRLFGEVLKAGQKVSRELDKVLQDAMHLNAKEEREIGSQINKMIMSRQVAIENPTLTSNLATLAAPFLRQLSRDDIDYTFTILDAPEVNAFAHLGGYIYVNRGLLDLVSSAGELQFVLGHEIAHVDLKHCAEQMTYSARASELVGETGASLVQMGYQVIALGYSEDKEFEADAWSVRTLGKGKEDAVRFLEKLAKLHDEGPTNDSMTPIGSITREIEGHFKTHPPTFDRLLAIGNLD